MLDSKDLLDEFVRGILAYPDIETLMNGVGERRWRDKGRRTGRGKGNRKGSEEVRGEKRYMQGRDGWRKKGGRKREKQFIGSLDGQQHMTGNLPPSSPTSYQSILHEEYAIARHFLC